MATKKKNSKTVSSYLQDVHFSQEITDAYKNSLKTVGTDFKNARQNIKKDNTSQRDKELGD